MQNETELIANLLTIARQAGELIMQVYASNDFLTRVKSDNSPLTEADIQSHQCIVNGLNALNLNIPIVSEEDEASHKQLQTSERFWLLDPLDGTKEFIARSHEFTVNIALVENGQAILGVVYAPALDLLYWGSANFGAWLQHNGTTKQLKLNAANQPAGKLRVVASKNHLNEETKSFIEKLGETTLVQFGSSLKICKIAEGEADIYPRLGPTCVWDTAAAHAVLSAAGGLIVDENLKPLSYQSAEVLNPHFIATSNLSFIR